MLSYMMIIIMVVYIFYFGVLSFRNNEDKFKYPVVQEL